jgi:tyrosine aminotransferase
MYLLSGLPSTYDPAHQLPQEALDILKK